MSKPRSPADEPTLFPREWVIGRAAADLVREDEGVLLDQPGMGPLAGAPAPGESRQAPPTVPAQERRGHSGVPIALVSAGGQAAGSAYASDPDLEAVLTSPSVEVGRRRPPRRPTAAEIEELKAAQARLQRRFEAARTRLRHLGGFADDETVVTAEAAAPIARCRPFPWRRLAIILVLAALASGLYQYRAVLFQL